MSYKWPGNAGPTVRATFGSTYPLSGGVSLFCYVYFPVNATYSAAGLLCLGIETTSLNGTSQIRVGPAADTVNNGRLLARSTDGAGATITNETIDAAQTSIEGVWTPVLARFRYVGGGATVERRIDWMGQSNDSLSADSASRDLDVMSIGCLPDGSGDVELDLRISHASFWDQWLSDTDATNLLDNDYSPSIVSASDLIGYYPLNTENATQSNEGVGGTANMSMTNVTWDAGVAAPTLITSIGHPAASRSRGIPGMNLIASRFGRGW